MTDKALPEIDGEKLEEEKYYVYMAMLHYGGSFFRGIGEALSHAHPTNAKKIRATWPDEWMKYLAMGRELADE